MKTVKKKLRKTRNIMLFLACGMVILYTVANVLFGVLNVRYEDRKSTRLNSSH